MEYPPQMDHGLWAGTKSAFRLLPSLMAAAGLVTILTPAAVWACSAGQTPEKAIPLAGATNVSTETSIVLESQSSNPGPLTLLVNGQPAGPVSLTDLGAGFPRTRFWRLNIGSEGQSAPLLPDAEYVLTTARPVNGPGELTRFRTGPGYDKTQGRPAVIRSLRLWRVRYPLSEIQSGNCVFAEYHGFIAVDYQPAEIPNTAPAGVVHTFSLRPQHGGLEQTMVYAEETPFLGLPPTGEHPTPIGAWHPDLDPTRAHCLTITAFGDGDRARLAVTSNVVCADVVEVSATGAPPPPGHTGGTSGGNTGGTSGDGTGGASSTGGISGTGSPSPGSGCSTSGEPHATASAATLGLFVLVLTAAVRRRRA